MSDELTVVLDPATTVAIGRTKGAPQEDRRTPRHALALTAMAAVLAVAFTVFGYQLRPFIHPQPLSQTVDPSPSAVVSGDVPASYLGSWHTTIANSTGHHYRSLVIKQGHIDDDVLILVADGPNYHCVFIAPLTAVSNGGSQLKLGPSAVTSAIPLSACKPAGPSVITLGNKDTLRRAKPENPEDALTYTR
ncbi:hypothetical protein ACFXAW_05605 [Streptomyces sp. NPDC059445]|uniref:hypothetical protein n=1 Tax=Streptomyces sp. NPDC059445 TaxID=3346832 RepID=UPI0036C45F99